MIYNQSKFLKKLQKTLCYFGNFDIGYLHIQNSGCIHGISTREMFVVNESMPLFTKQFSQFVLMMPSHSVKFYHAKSSIFLSGSHGDCYQIVMIQKEVDACHLTILCSDNKKEIIHLLLHKEVIRRLALYIKENFKINKNPKKQLIIKDSLFRTDSMICDGDLTNDLLKETFSLLLTQKEQKMIESYLQHHSVKKVANQADFSRSYITQILLSAAHKLGLTKVQDILSLQQHQCLLIKQGISHD